MPRNDNAVRYSPSLDDAAVTETFKANDYSEGMFADGNNRTANGKKNAAAYDEAAHTGSAAEDDFNNNDTQPMGVLQSRDGTEASGILDEDGGSLGGTEDELDSLEAGGTPVDKNPRMKD